MNNGTGVHPDAALLFAVGVERERAWDNWTAAVNAYGDAEELTFSDIRRGVENATAKQQY